jgi:hypothetical protein
MKEDETHSYPIRQAIPHRSSGIRTRITPIPKRQPASPFWPLDTGVLFVPSAYGNQWLRDPGGAAERAKGRP